MAAPCRVKDVQELRLPPQRIEQRVACEIRIGEKPAVHTAVQDAERRSSIPECSVGLGDFVSGFRVAHRTLVEPCLDREQNVFTLRHLMSNREAQRTTDLCLQKRAVQFVCTIKVSCRSVPIFFVVFTKTTIKNDQRLVHRTGKTFEKPVVLTEIQVAIQHGAVELYTGIEPAGELGFYDRL